MTWSSRLAKPDAQARALDTVNKFWQPYEISGTAMVDMAVWHGLRPPQARPPS